MPDKLEIEVVEETPDSPDSSPKFWDKIKKFVSDEITKAKAKKMDAGKVAMAAKILGMTPAALADALGGEMDEEEMEMGEKDVKKTGQDETPEGEEALTKSTDQPTTPDAVAALEAIQKAHLDAIEKAHQAQMEQLTKALEDKYQAQIAGLTERVEKAETERGQAKEEAERREFIEKALTYRTLPVKHGELGDLLHKMSKALDTDTYAKVEGILKSADAQLGAAGIFGEFGTARTPEEVTLEEGIEKAAQEQKVDYADALLGLPEEKQRQLLKSMQGGKK